MIIKERKNEKKVHDHRIKNTKNGNMIEIR